MICAKFAHWAQRIFREKGYKFVQWKGHVNLNGMMVAKTVDAQLLKNLMKNRANLNQIWHKAF